VAIKQHIAQGAPANGGERSQRQAAEQIHARVRRDQHPADSKHGHADQVQQVKQHAKPSWLPIHSLVPSRPRAHLFLHPLAMHR